MPSETRNVKVTLLGTGTSTGIPVIGCPCRVCRSEDPKDKRTRCSCYVEADGVSLVIDTGPDFRAQALRFSIPRVDAVLFTHHHFDHVAGLDDLRPYLFENRSPIPCYAPPETARVLRSMYGYVFSDGSYPGVPSLDLFTCNGPFTVPSRFKPGVFVPVVPIPAFHGSMPLVGYRIGNFAYLTDTSVIPDASWPLLQKLDVLVLDALREKPHPTHFSFAQAIEVARRVRARETFFIHMSHSVLHREVNASLPVGVSLAYDGLQIELRG